MRIIGMVRRRRQVVRERTVRRSGGWRGDPDVVKGAENLPANLVGNGHSSSENLNPGQDTREQVTKRTHECRHESAHEGTHQRKTNLVALF